MTRTAGASTDTLADWRRAVAELYSHGALYFGF